jgi:polyisoprenoid-binding protein YceI
MENSMKTSQIVPLSLLFILLGCQSVFAEARTWQLDKAHSNIYFSIDHIFSKVHGHFNEFTADVNFDPANLAESSFNFEIEVDSIDTNIGKRDKHLKSGDFFDEGKYPQIIFKSEKITEVGADTYEVAGKMTIKGTSYDLVLPLVLEGVKDHPTAKGKEVAGFNGTISLDRLAYKVGGGKFYEMGVVGKNVDVLVTMELLADK